MRPQCLFNYNTRLAVAEGFAPPLQASGGPATNGLWIVWYWNVAING